MADRRYRLLFQIAVSVGLLVASVVCQGLRTDGTTKKPTENTTLAGPDNTTQEPSKNAIDTSKDVVANSSMTGLIRTSGNGALILKGSKSGDNQSEIVLANVTAAPVFAPDGTLVKLIVDSGSGKGSALVDNKNKTSTKLTQVIVQLNHRIELEPMDFQMNNTKQPKLNINVAITTLITAGSIPISSIARQKQTLGARAATGAVTNISLVVDDDQEIVMARPETTTGVQLLFKGTYKNVADDNSDNKVPVPRTFFLDLCGSISDKAFIQVVITKPVDKTYICAINLAFPTAARDTEAIWTDPITCESIQDEWSFRLWFKLRQYNIGWYQCQQNRPVVIMDEK